MVDFFPVHFDIKEALEILPEDKYQYFLKHESQAASGGTVFAPTFNVAWYPEAVLDGDPEGADGASSFLRNITRAEDVAGRAVHTMPANGSLQIPNAMLTAAKNGKGVALFEVRFLTDNPIVLEIKKNDGTSVAEVEMPVRISEVEDMFRSRYLSENLAGGTQGGVPGSPSNWPDIERNGKHFIFVHGYNVSGEQSRGWHSEMFKRMFWSGSNAMFTGVSWNGNESQIGPFNGVYLCPDYWSNVHNAFRTSNSMADFVNALPGGVKCIAAHSLGNVVVSSAIRDYGLNVSKYYMVDAAAAIEAYDKDSEFGKDDISHPDWRPYARHLWSSDWHKLFAADPADKRNRLTWVDRFGAFPHAYNFHSTGEEVLKNGTGEIPAIGAVRAWVNQEMLKGRPLVATLSSDSGGWDFNSKYTINPLNPLQKDPISPSAAAQIGHEVLKEHPFFDPFDNGALHNPDPVMGSSAVTYDVRAETLAESIPSLTFAAGANPIDKFDPQNPNDEERNFDMNGGNFKVNGWPAQRDKILEGTEISDWRHSDIRNMSYLYTYKVYEKWIELGELNE